MQLNFQRHGIEKGVPLLILHGLFGSLDNWLPVSRLLGESYPVITLDLRNHGRSPHHEEFNYDVMAADVRELLEKQCIQKANLLGHSMGGKAAMTFALNYPETTGKLIVVDIAPGKYPPIHQPIFEALLALKLEQFNERHEVERALARDISDAAVRKWLLKNVGRTDAGKLCWKMNLPAIHRNYHLLNAAFATGKTFDGPVLFIKGGQSDYITAEDVPVIAKLFPRTDFKTINGAGHWVHAEAPDALITFVKRFLR